MSTEIYLGVTFAIELDENLTHDQADDLRGKFSGKVVELELDIPGLPDIVRDYIDEVEVLTFDE